jgi:hypothetical protein
MIPRCPAKYLKQGPFHNGSSFVVRVWS